MSGQNLKCSFRVRNQVGDRQVRGQKPVKRNMHGSAQRSPSFVEYDNRIAKTVAGSSCPPRGRANTPWLGAPSYTRQSMQKGRGRNSGEGPKNKANFSCIEKESQPLWLGGVFWGE